MFSLYPIQKSNPKKVPNPPIVEGADY